MKGASPVAAHEEAFIDTPYGIVTASGVWFHVPEEGLRDYAGPVLDHVPLERLITWATRWLDSPKVLAVWMLSALLLMVPPLVASLWTVGFFVGWGVFGPSIASVAAAKAMRYLAHPVVQGLFYVLVLSFLAAQDQFIAVTVGLAGFIVLRWGILGWLTRPLVRVFQRMLYNLPVADQVLRSYIVRVALSKGLDVPHVDRMARAMIDNWNSRRDDTT